MKLFEIVFDPEKDAGVYAMSVVNQPAMEDAFIALSEQEKVQMTFESVNDEKRILLGAALIPDKKIYRNIDGNEFEVVFSKETVEKLAHYYLQNGNQKNSSQDHKFKVDGCTIVESWIVEDPENDKSKMFNKQYAKGSWVIMMKVDNDEVWKQAKEGKLNGFSIEAFFGLKEMDLNVLNMEKQETKKSLAEEIKEGFAALMSKLGTSPVELKRMKLKDGAVVEFDGDTPEIGKPIFGLSKDKSEKFRMPKGKYEFEEGGTVHVDDAGLIAEAPVEEPKEDEAKEVKEAVTEMSKQFTDAIEALNKNWEAKFEQMERKFQLKLASEEKKNEALEAKLNKQPGEEKIDSETFQSEAKLSKNKPTTTRERLFESIMNLKN